jgi:phosphatidylglycerophosphate synthase
MAGESWAVVAVFILVLSLGLIYFLRGLASGEFKRYERVDRQGGSALLGKAVMNFAVWCVEPLVKLLQRGSVTPNQVTFVSLLFGLLAAASIALGHFGYGFCLALLSGVSDVLDGMLARLRGTVDRGGVVLDSTIDRYVDFMLLAGCALFFRHQFWALLACLLAVHGSFMISYTTAKAEAMQLTIPRGAMKRTERYVYLLLGLAGAAFWPQGLPLLLVIWLLAVLGNVSAALRFRALFLAARAG